MGDMEKSQTAAAADDTSGKKKRPLAQRIVREVCIIAAVLLLLFSARWSLADHYRIPTGSMQPSVEIDDRVVVNKASYDVRLPFTDVTLIEVSDPARGEVVVLDSPEDGTLLLKRIVAIPGDTVEVRGGRLRINEVDVPVERDGDVLLERLGERTHRLELGSGGGPDFGPVLVPERHYLVMGDNRGNSRDGRIFGLVERRRIRGEAVGVYYRGGLGWHAL